MNDKEKVPQDGTLYEMAPLVREWDAALLFHVENFLLRGIYELGIDEILREQLAEACDRMLAYAYQTGAVTLSEEEAAMILYLHKRPAWSLYRLCMQRNPHIAHSRYTHTAKSHREKAADMCTPSERNDTEDNPPVLNENP